jgi:hypothetical protein
MEDQLGNTHLFYRIYTAGYGTMGYYYSNNIYRLNPVSGYDNFFLGEGGFADQFDQVNDYEFWENDYNRYIYAGTHIYLEPFPEVYRYDQMNPIFSPQMWGVSRNIELSRQDTNIIMFSVDNGFNYKSTDWGNSWDSISPGYQILSLSPFNHDIIFASQELNLLKSIDGGNSFFTVDTGKIYSPNFIYDSNGLHIYAHNSRLGGNLEVSNNNGEPFSWQTKYTSDSKIYISVDESTSGTIYLADKKNILVSTDFGNNFNLYKTLERKIVGIYKKPNSDKLYAATKYKIYEITPDTVKIIKWLLAVDDLKWYPLSTGNKWVYENYRQEFNPPGPKEFIGFSTMEVLGDISVAGQNYYQLNDEPLYWNIDTGLIRIDSLEAKLFIYLPEENKEVLYEDFLTQVGDTTWIDSVEYKILDNEESFTVWGMNTFKRLIDYQFRFQGYELVKNIGLYKWSFNDSFALYTKELKGCVIDGIVYGDTTTVDVEDEENPIASEFKLEQNYPNPFNPTTNIGFRIADFGFVSLKIYDVLGNEIATLVNEEKPAGEYEVEFNPESSIKQPASGIYFYQIKAGDFIQTKKMVLLK